MWAGLTYNFKIVFGVKITFRAFPVTRFFTWLTYRIALPIFFIPFTRSITISKLVNIFIQTFTVTLQSPVLAFSITKYLPTWTGALAWCFFSDTLIVAQITCKLVLTNIGTIEFPFMWTLSKARSRKVLALINTEPSLIGIIIWAFTFSITIEDILRIIYRTETLFQVNVLASIASWHVIMLSVGLRVFRVINLPAKW
jgi:hypothetical protein